MVAVGAALAGAALLLYGASLAEAPARPAPVAELAEGGDEPVKPRRPASAAGVFPSAAATSLRTVVAASSGSAWQFLGHEILRELDRGGLGVVFLARHAMLHELRAIKRPLDHETLDSASVVERFKREVRAVGLLKNEHVIRAHDAGIDQYGPYLVMEYLEGLPISKLVGRLGPLPIPLACELGEDFLVILLELFLASLPR